jgi:acyl-coenzyme A thioesterase PaaI-like protein
MLNAPVMSLVLCGGCRDLGRCRFGVTSELLDAETARFELECPAEYEGGPRTSHGGWTAAVMTELLGRTMKLQGLLSVIGAMSMTFDRPVPVGISLAGESRIVTRKQRKFQLAASLSLASSGAKLAEATGTAVILDGPEYYERFERWLKEQRVSGK